MLFAPDLLKTAPVREKCDCFVVKAFVQLYFSVSVLFYSHPVCSLECNGPFSNLGFLFISHVQSMVEIKTDIGHARAWIR